MYASILMFNMRCGPTEQKLSFDHKPVEETVEALDGWFPVLQRLFLFRPERNKCEKDFENVLEAFKNVNKDKKTFSKAPTDINKLPQIQALILRKRSTCHEAAPPERRK